jgi:hypothetical protein
MNTDRRAILSLIAMGRITPREAERLLVVSSGSDDAIVRIVLLCALAWLLVPHAHEIVTGLSHAVDTIALWATTSGRHAVALAIDVFGGKL